MSQSHKDITIPRNKGELWLWPTGSGAACLGRSVPSMVAEARPGIKRELEGGLTGSSALSQSTVASSRAP